MSSLHFSSPILKIKDFRFLLLTRFLISLALQYQDVIVGWQIYQLKHDALLLGLVGLAEAIPAITCSFFSGHVVDISKPAKVYHISLFVMTLNTLFILSAVLPSLGFQNSTRIFILFAGVFISGLARSFTGPSVFSLIPQVVPKPLIPAAAALNSSVFQFAAITGPALGGLIYGFVGPVTAFSVPCLFACCAFLGSGLISPKAETLSTLPHREPFIKSLRAGIKFAFGHKVLLSAMSLDMFSVLFGGAFAVLPVFADQVFHVGSTGLGILRAAPAVGSVLISLYLGLRPMEVISGQRLLLVVGGFGAATLGFALSTNFYLALIFLCFAGLFDGVSMVIRGTLLQLLIPDHMRGRVSALSSMFIISSNEIGAFESGLAAKLMGLIPSVIFGGAMTLIVVAMISWLSPDLKNTRLKASAD
jgi:MFS family permease